MAERWFAGALPARCIIPWSGTTSRTSFGLGMVAFTLAPEPLPLVSPKWAHHRSQSDYLYDIPNALLLRSILPCVEGQQAETDQQEHHRTGLRDVILWVGWFGALFTDAGAEIGNEHRTVENVIIHIGDLK
jgi:hypothetical protein